MKLLRFESSLTEKGALATFEALALGAVDFISKPINAAVVRARVHAHLTLRRHADAVEAAHTGATKREGPATGYSQTVPMTAAPLGDELVHDIEVELARHIGPLSKVYPMFRLKMP